jgi:uncharacterized protein involved in outer membrane biogenesis
MTRRNLIIAGAAVLIVAVGVVATVVSRADRLVKGLIEEHGSAATQTAVRVEHVDIRLASTSAKLAGLTIANPAGFSAMPAVRLDEVQISVDAASLGAAVLVLDEVQIVGPRVNFELDANRQANVDVIRRNVEHYGDAGHIAAGTPPSDTTPVATRVQKSTDRTRVIIKRLLISEGHVEIDATALGGKHKVVDLPDTEVANIGEDSGGATGGEIAHVIAMALIRDVGTAVAATQVQTKIEEALGGKTGKAVGKGVGEVIKGLGGVINDMMTE